MTFGQQVTTNLVDANVGILSVACLEAGAERRRGAVNDVEVEETNAEVELLRYCKVLSKHISTEKCPAYFWPVGTWKAQLKTASMLQCKLNLGSLSVT